MKSRLASAVFEAFLVLFLIGFASDLVEAGHPALAFLALAVGLGAISFAFQASITRAGFRRLNRVRKDFRAARLAAIRRRS